MDRDELIIDSLKGIFSGIALIAAYFIINHFWSDMSYNWEIFLKTVLAGGIVELCSNLIYLLFGINKITGIIGILMQIALIGFLIFLLVTEFGVIGIVLKIVLIATIIWRIISLIIGFAIGASSKN